MKSIHLFTSTNADNHDNYDLSWSDMKRCG